MGLFRKSRPNATEYHSFTASGASYQVATYADATRLSQLRQVWQQTAYDTYELEGHLYYATNYIGDAMSRIELVAARRKKGANPDDRPEFVTSGPIHEAVKKITSPNGGQSGLLRQIGKNIFISGEVWMIGSEPATPDGITEQSWDAVSIDELSVGRGAQGGYLRRRSPGTNPEPLTPGSLVFRIWKQHPRWSELADAGTRSCLPLLEKIITINRAETAVARSRFAGSGILGLPQELVAPAWQNQANSPDPKMANPLWTGLYEAMSAPIADQSHPNAIMPFLLVGPGEIIKNIKYEPMERTFDAEAASLSIQNAIEQVATTLELPKEILLGMGTVTHWTAWAVKEDVFQAHIQPLIEMVCEAMTLKYLAQALKTANVPQSDDEYEYIVWYDASQLIQRPDKGDKALAIHDRFALSDEALRRETGFTEQDKPSDLEYAKRVGIKMVDPGMAIDGKPTPPPAPASPAGGPGGSTPLGTRGKTPQGPRSKPPGTASQRRKSPGPATSDKAPASISASAAKRSDGALLGHFDLIQLKTLRKLMDEQVTRALRTQSLVAASSGDDLVSEAMVREFTEFMEATYAGAFNSVAPLLSRLYVPASAMEAPLAAAMRDSIAQYRKLLATLIDNRAFKPGGTPLLGEFISGAGVQFGDVRPLLVAIGGGSPDVTVDLMGGPASGRLMQDWLTQNGVGTAQKIWLYGDTSRRVFNGHLQMDGLVFEDWNEETLDIAPQDAWLKRDKYAPGDHWGCGCIVAPYLPNWGDPFELQLS